MTVRGKLVVSMVYEIPVSGEQYQRTLRDKGEVTVLDILDAEEQNYRNNIDTYVEAISDYITEVEFSFKETQGRRDG